MKKLTTLTHLSQRFYVHYRISIVKLFIPTGQRDKYKDVV